MMSCFVLETPPAMAVQVKMFVFNLEKTNLATFAKELVLTNVMTTKYDARFLLIQFRDVCILHFVYQNGQISWEIFVQSNNVLKYARKKNFFVQGKL